MDDEGNGQKAKNRKHKSDAPKRPKKAKEMSDPNKIKTSNKLIGELENNDLYASDEEGDTAKPAVEQEDLRREQLDLGTTQANKKDMNKFLQKFQAKASIKDVPTGLGLLRGDLNINELAAKGIQISLKEKLERLAQQQQQAKIKQTTTKTTTSETVTTIQTESNQCTQNEQMGVTTTTLMNCTIEEEQKTEIINAAVQTQIKKTTTLTTVTIAQEKEEESGLIFVDPAQERKLQQEKEKQLKKKEQPVIILKNGGVVAAHMSTSGQNEVLKNPHDRLRFLTELKTQQRQKLSRDVNFDIVKQSVLHRDLTADDLDKKKQKSTPTAEEQNQEPEL